MSGFNCKPDRAQTSHYNLDHLVTEWQKKYSEHRFSNIFLRFVSFLENIYLLVLCKVIFRILDFFQPKRWSEKDKKVTVVLKNEKTKKLPKNLKVAH